MASGACRVGLRWCRREFGTIVFSVDHERGLRRPVAQGHTLTPHLKSPFGRPGQGKHRLRATVYQEVRWEFSRSLSLGGLRDNLTSVKITTHYRHASVRRHGNEGELCYDSRVCPYFSRVALSHFARMRPENRREIAVLLRRQGSRRGTGRRGPTETRSPFCLSKFGVNFHNTILSPGVRSRDLGGN